MASWDGVSALHFCWGVLNEGVHSMLCQNVGCKVSYYMLYWHLAQVSCPFAVTKFRSWIIKYNNYNCILTNINDSIKARFHYRKLHRKIIRKNHKCVCTKKSEVSINTAKHRLITCEKQYRNLKTSSKFFVYFKGFLIHP